MSDPHPPPSNFGDDHGHGGGHHSGHSPAPALAQPPMVAYVTPAPVWPQPQAYAAPVGHCCCGGPTPTMLQPWPTGGGFMVCCRVCGLAKDEHGKHGHDEHKTEPPPEFSDATPEAFRHRFKDVWEAVQANRIPAGIIADCHALLLVLLHGLDGQDAKAARKAGSSGWGKPKPAASEPLERLKTLLKNGKLLGGVVKAAEGIRLDPGDIDIAPLGDPERARRYMNLIWQIADQGYEQVRWSDSSQSPPRAKAPEPKDHGDGHGH